MVASPPAIVQPQPEPASYRELLELDSARRMRVLSVPRPVTARRLAPGDRDLLAWLAAARCALTSQIHRRVNPERSLTVTQRQLKRLADCGLIARFQLHRGDGGGLPLCCAVTDRTVELLGVSGRRAPELRESALGSLRADVHLVGWLLALEARAGDATAEVLGPRRAGIAPGVREPAALDLGDRLRARDFLVSRRDGSRVPVERFGVVRPDAALSLRIPGERSEHGGDLLVVADAGDPIALLEAYDHLLSGWWRSVARYRRAGGPPAVVMICADDAHALARVAAADAVLTACLAEIGEPPQRWQRPGRERIHFVAEVDLHRGLLSGWRVPLLPPALRGAAAFQPLRGSFAQLPPARSSGAAKPPWR